MPISLSVGQIIIAILPCQRENYVSMFPGHLESIEHPRFVSSIHITYFYFQKAFTAHILYTNGS